MQAIALEAAAPPLNDLRREIDRVDDAIAELIARRTALAARVGSAKSGVNPYRPAREAEVLARMGCGALPDPLVRAVWRELISAALHAQGLAEIVVDNEALAAPARAHFGAMLPVRVDAAALAHVARPDALVVIADADELPPGVYVASALDAPDGRRAGYVLGTSGDAR